MDYFRQRSGFSKLAAQDGQYGPWIRLTPLWGARIELRSDSIITSICNSPPMFRGYYGLSEHRVSGAAYVDFPWILTSIQRSRFG